MSQQLSDIKRLLENLICYATVVAADYPNARVKVDISGRNSAWIPWLTDSAAGDRSWDAPEIGEQVVVLCPSGNPANGVIAGALFKIAAPAPANDVDITRRVHGDGMVVEHDRKNKITRINALDSEGTLVLEAKNIVIRTGEDGYFHKDHHGYATRLTHKGGPDFESEVWIDGAIVTGKPDYALKAFDYDVTDYLHKPITMARFDASVRRAVAKYEQEHRVHEDEEHIFVKSNLKKRKVILNDIKWIEALGDYIKLVTDEANIVILSTMKSFEKQLPEEKFLRIHKSYIVNLEKVEKFNSKNVEVSGRSIPLSRNKKTELAEALSNV